MFVLGLFVGATISLVLYGVLHAGATAKVKTLSNKTNRDWGLF